MNALTLYQPWATLVAMGWKRYETRHWVPSVAALGRPLAIHASKRWDSTGKRWAARFGVSECPLGVIVCFVELIGWHRCREVAGELVEVDRSEGTDPLLQRTPTADLSATSASIPRDPYGDYAPGRFAWRLDAVQVPRHRIPIKGRQGLWRFALVDPPAMDPVEQAPPGR